MIYVFTIHNQAHEAKIPDRGPIPFPILNLKKRSEVSQKKNIQIIGL